MMTIAKNSMDSNLKMDKMQVEGTDKYIGGIYYYVPNEKSVNTISTTLQEHLGVTNKMNIKIIIKRLLELSRQPFYYNFSTYFSYTL